MMEIYLEKARKILHVLFANAELTEEPFENVLFRRRFGDTQGVTFTFEKTGNGFFLYISFARYKDPGVLCQVTNGQSVVELRVLWRLAHLPCAKLFFSKVMLPDGRSVELIDTVGFELRKVWEGVWDTEANESEAKWRIRQMKLNRMKDEVPGIFSETPLSRLVLGQAVSAGTELLFSNTLAESETGTQSDGTGPTSSMVTAEDVNNAIQLLLWRCRDAQIHKDKPEGKRGFYKLDDWITNANDPMIYELGMWCADIQELNIGTRDS